MERQVQFLDLDTEPLIAVVVLHDCRYACGTGAIFCQCLAVSEDGGKHFTKFEGNPIVDWIETDRSYVQLPDKSSLTVRLLIDKTRSSKILNYMNLGLAGKKVREWVATTDRVRVPAKSSRSNTPSLIDWQPSDRH